MPKPIQNRPKKDRWDMKRILSTIFVAFISGLLVLLFVVGDCSAGFEGGGAGHGALARIAGRPVHYHDLRDEMNIIQNESRRTEQEISHDTMLDQALGMFLLHNTFLWGARQGGITLSEMTRLEILHHWFQQSQTPPRQFAAAPRSHRREVEQRINEAYLSDTFRYDIASSPNSTSLSLRIENEVRALRSTLDLVYIDIQRMADEITPGNEELREYFTQAAGSRGTERWRRVRNFDELDREARGELLESWKRENAQFSYFSAFQDANNRMDTLEQALAEGRALPIAAREAGLPLYTTAPFSWGETPRVGGREFPVSAEFYRPALTLPEGSTSGVMRMPADFPQVLLLFRVRARQNVPVLDMDLLANRAEFERLPAARQAEMRRSLNSLAEQHRQNASFAILQDVYSFLLNSARVTILPRERFD
jgi:hypothetical protein